MINKVSNNNNTINIDTILPEILSFQFKNEDIDVRINSFSFSIFDMIHRFGRLQIIPLKWTVERFQTLRYRPFSIMINIRMIALVILAIPNTLIAIPGTTLCMFAKQFSQYFAFSPSTKGLESKNPAQMSDLTDVKEDENQLKVMTWNTALGPGFMSLDNRLAQPMERVPAIVKMIDYQNPHVVALQELFDTDANEAIVKELNERGYDCIHSVLSTSSVALSSGLLLAVKRESTIKLKIEEAKVWQFNNLTHADRLSNKGLLGIKLQVLNEYNQSQTLHIFNTHLQSSYDNQGCGEIRQEQVAAMAHRIQAWTKADQTPSQPNKNGIIFCGDFNFARNPMEKTDNRKLKPLHPKTEHLDHSKPIDSKKPKHNHEGNQCNEYALQIDELRRAHLIDPNQQAQFSDKGSFYYLKKEKPVQTASTVDYIFLSDSLKQAHQYSKIIDLNNDKSSSKFFPSDHCPLVCSLNLA